MKGKWLRLNKNFPAKIKGISDYFFPVEKKFGL
jgi:hypothetical protein